MERTSDDYREMNQRRHSSAAAATHGYVNDQPPTHVSFTGVNLLVEVGKLMMASTEHQPITESRAEPLLRGPGAKPPEAESILSFGSANEAPIFPFLLSYKLSKYIF